MHGGTVDADSPGARKGSVFSVRLPAAESPARRLGDSRATRQSTARPQRVLVVDDNADVAQTLGWMLETIGHDYLIVHDGGQALLAAKDFGPDVVFLDIGYREWTATPCAGSSGATKHFQHLPIIAQTGWSQDRDKARSSDAGFDHHLVKPAALEDFERLLADLATPRSPAEITRM